jgi:CubicO group peptidase (beta-lactamase class C family)
LRLIKLIIIVFVLILVSISLVEFNHHKIQEKILEEKKEAINFSLDKLMKNYGVVGCSLMIIEDKKPFYYYNYGFANKENHEFLTPRHAIRIASISKLITSIIVLKTLENYPHLWNQSITKLLGVPFANPNFPEHSITIKDLLSHTTGFYPYYEPTNEFFKESLSSNNLNIREILTENGQYYRDFFWNNTSPPKTKYEYSGFNYLVLATILEKITEKRFDQLVEEIIIKPLELKNSHLPTTFPSEKTNYALGYYYKNDNVFISLNDNLLSIRNNAGQYAPGINPSIHIPQAGFRSSINDLTKIMLMLLNEGIYNNKLILNKNSISILETPFFEKGIIARSLGAEINKTFLDNTLLIGHSGNAYGILTHFFYNRETGTGIIFFINGLKDNQFDHTGEHLEIEEKVVKTVYKYLL